MRKLLFLFLLAPLCSMAQNKPYLEVGGVGGYYFKSETLAYGASIGLNGHMNEFLTIGVGFMPLWEEKVKKPQLPVYGDVRIRLDKRASLMLQPGYNLYKNTSNVTTSTFSGKGEVKGGFYGGAGIAFDFPVTPNTALYLHAKYNYFAFNNEASVTVGGNTTNSTSKTNRDALTLGVGLRLQ
jgi:hypothetical protein